MAGTPRFKVYAADGEYRAAFKYPEDAAALIAMLGDGSTIRDGHDRRDIAWNEGREAQPASESYDYVEQVVRERTSPEAIAARMVADRDRREAERGRG